MRECILEFLPSSHSEKVWPGWSFCAQGSFCLCCMMVVSNRFVFISLFNSILLVCESDCIALFRSERLFISSCRGGAEWEGGSSGEVVP